jgi:hypothetical protein
MSEVLETSLDEEAQKRVRPIVTWLLEERLNIGRTTFLFALYCQRLRDIGISLDRATIHMPQLHPQISARSCLNSTRRFPPARSCGCATPGAPWRPATGIATAPTISICVARSG